VHDDLTLWCTRQRACRGLLLNKRSARILPAISIMSTAAVDRMPSEMHVYRNPGVIASTGGLTVPDAAMITALLEGRSSDGSKTDLLINTMQLVEPRHHMAVPNHVLETSMWNQ